MLVSAAIMVLMMGALPMPMRPAAPQPVAYAFRTVAEQSHRSARAGASPQQPVGSLPQPVDRQASNASCGSISSDACITTTTTLAYTTQRTLAQPR